MIESPVRGISVFGLLVSVEVVDSCLGEGNEGSLALTCRLLRHNCERNLRSGQVNGIDQVSDIKLITHINIRLLILGRTVNFSLSPISTCRAARAFFRTLRRKSARSDEESTNGYMNIRLLISDRVADFSVSEGNEESVALIRHATTRFSARKIRPNK